MIVRTYSRNDKDINAYRRWIPTDLDFLKFCELTFSNRNWTATKQLQLSLFFNYVSYPCSTCSSHLSILYKLWNHRLRKNAVFANTLANICIIYVRNVYHRLAAQRETNLSSPCNKYWLTVTRSSITRKTRPKNSPHYEPVAQQISARYRKISSESIFL